MTTSEVLAILATRVRVQMVREPACSIEWRPDAGLPQGFVKKGRECFGTWKGIPRKKSSIKSDGRNERTSKVKSRLYFYPRTYSPYVKPETNDGRTEEELAKDEKWARQAYHDNMPVGSIPERFRGWWFDEQQKSGPPGRVLESAG